MPQQPGEAPLCTLFADVHYYFSHPSARPAHHRFDKGSYVYLYYNPNEHRGRVEIANYAGTPDQDAFTGYLDAVSVNRTHKQPNLFTITVDPTNAGSTPGSPQQDYSQWHLPAPDQRNEGKYMFKLHTVDLYMWTENDANTLVNSLQQVLQPHQLRILDAPTNKTRHSEHSDSMSPVVKKLEQMAVTNPHQYRSNSYASTPTPTHPGMQRQSTMPAGYPSYNPSQQPQPQYANYPQSPGYAPVQSPGHVPPGTPGFAPAPGTPGHASTPLQSPGYAPSPGLPPPPPAGGYSQYSYGQPTGQPQSQSDMYAVHSQLYRPTEHEANTHHHTKVPANPQAGPGVPGPGKFEQRVDRVEKGVSKFLKRLDKKL
ncbi:putative rna recognition motif-containing protein [Neofusicoccum parvum UCRNP2]|uniref:Putative rna recognition motif-containing protein n=1 Tax=Botryosphaeria parva (strain UCR-NP2) TaxID=1287680 RepID=R1GI70_BOTPV|nr:putative rna recognition motif-containing protein [Neofusicoccum parvum UCRNP2]